jgi:hypothetical protein
MADQRTERDLLDEVQQGAQMMSLLAENDETFRAVVDAFRAQDGESLQLLLARHELARHCEIICHWLRSKECVLLCLHLAGPPPREVEDPPDVREFADVVARVADDEELVERMAYAVHERDADTWAELIERNELRRFSHLLCHWVCTVHYRLVCDVVCTPGVIHRPHLVPELVQAARAIGKFAADERQFASAVEAVNAGECLRLSSILAGSQHCHRICEWFCSWRSMLVCLRLCRIFPLERLASPIGEMLEFARAGGRLAKEQGVLGRLTAAILRDDDDTVQELVKRYEFAPYCIQFCHWVCFLRCERFCICVCPPPDTHPLFTHVGQYKIAPYLAADGVTVLNDFQPDGTTTAGDLAFTSTIPLNGILPDGLASQAAEYRFRVTKHAPGAPVQDVEGALAAETEIGQLAYRYWDALTSSWEDGATTYWVNNPGAVAVIPQEFGPPLTRPVNVDIGPGGWIAVPRENDPGNGGGGRFVRDYAQLLKLKTTALTDEHFHLDVGPLVAGDGVPATERSEAPTYRIAFEWRIVGDAAVHGNALETIALSNTHYTCTHHPEWAGGTYASTSVCMIDILELRPPAATGCDRLRDTMHALFTAYHPYLGTVTMSIEGNGPPPDVTPPIVANEAASGPAGHLYDISAMAPCAYVLWLTVSLRLTSGYGQLPGETDHIAFCKDKKRVAPGEKP